MNQQPQFKRGAIAILDALGMKNSWCYRHPTDTLQSYISLRTGLPLFLDNLKKSLQPADELFDFGISNFSDTVVITTTLRNQRLNQTVPLNPALTAEEIEYLCLVSVTQLTKFTIVAGAQLDPPLIFRGAIATGELFVEEDIIIGPAVDEAASIFGIAKSAVVFVDSRASEIIGQMPDIYQRMSLRPAYPGDPEELPRLDDLFICNYPLIFKEGFEATTLVNPFKDVYLEGRTRMKAGFEAKFAEKNSEDVTVKRANTMAFLEHTDKITPFPPNREIIEGRAVLGDLGISIPIRHDPSGNS